MPKRQATHEPTDESRGDALYRDPDLARFYDLANAWSPEFATCEALAKNATSVLDLGCGTGQLAARLAAVGGEGAIGPKAAGERRVVGADPAAAMLEIARRRAGGERVTWVQADARTLRLDRRFDLVVMTGHAFQVFLADEDQRQVLATVAAHLAANGRFVFDSRNPAAKAWREWRPKRSKHWVEHPKLGAVQAWNDAEYDKATKIVTYETHYQVLASGQTFSATARIRFTRKKTLAAMLADAGLAVDDWLGTWAGEPWSAASPEIIPLGRLAAPPAAARAKAPKKSRKRAR